MEVVHSCTASELCKSLFCLPDAYGEDSVLVAREAAAAACEQLRSWVGTDVFDSCERVTLQLLKGPVSRAFWGRWHGRIALDILMRPADERLLCPTHVC